MEVLKIGQKYLQSLPITDFPLLRKHLEQRKGILLYQEYPDLLFYFILVEKEIMYGILGGEYCKYGLDDFLYISPIEIVEDRRRKGLGKLLLNEVKKQVKDSQITGLCLMCNEDVLDFYRKNGFVEEYSYIDEGKIVYFLIYKLSEEELSHGRN